MLKICDLSVCADLQGGPQLLDDRPVTDLALLRDQDTCT